MDMQSRLYRGKTVFNTKRNTTYACNRSIVLRRVSKFLQKWHPFEQKSLNSRVTVGWSRHSIDLSDDFFSLDVSLKLTKIQKKSQNSRAIIS